MQLRVLSYNVRYFGHALKGLATTRGGLRGIAATLSAMDPLPEVVCLQEVETASLRSTLVYRRSHEAETQLEAFMRELERAFAARGRPLPYEAFYFRAHSTSLVDVTLQSMGLAILVDVTRVRVDHHNAHAPERITHYHVQRFKDRKQNRICAHMRLHCGDGSPVHIFNTHLSLPTPFARAFWSGKERMGFGINQLHEARSLAQFVHKLAGEEPFLVVGDFNSPPASPVYRYLTEEVGFVGGQAALRQIDPGDPRGFPTAGFLRLRMHLDHLFGGGGLRFVDLDGTCPYGDRGSPFAGKSDHMPLIARIDVPASSALRSGT